jgi:menaquinone-dependent protoporphyrinogen IX oxidase
MSIEKTPKVLFVYYSFSQQTQRVVDAMAGALTARGCDVTTAAIEFTDARYLKRFAKVPMRHPMLEIVGMLPAQLRRKTGEIRIPVEAQSGDYDLVVFGSPTWWLTTNMPIRSYLKSSAAKAVLDGTSFAAASVSRRYYKGNLKGIQKLGEENGGKWVDKTHFVVAGGQVKSMLSWLGYMKHGEAQERVFGMKMPPPNLKPDFVEQAQSFIDSVADRALGARVVSINR